MSKRRTWLRDVPDAQAKGKGEIITITNDHRSAKTGEAIDAIRAGVIATGDVPREPQRMSEAQIMATCAAMARKGIYPRVVQFSGQSSGHINYDYATDVMDVQCGCGVPMSYPMRPRHLVLCQCGRCYIRLYRNLCVSDLNSQNPDT